MARCTRALLPLFFLLKIGSCKLLKRGAPESVGAIHTPIVAGVHPLSQQGYTPIVESGTPLSCQGYTSICQGYTPIVAGVYTFS